MKSQWQAVATLAVVVLLVIALGHLWNNSAQAQAGGGAAATTPRYQISAYASPRSGGVVHHGCYIVDSTSGQIWHTRAGGEVEKVSEAPR
jgi:hypothetical protein